VGPADGAAATHTHTHSGAGGGGRASEGAELACDTLVAAGAAASGWHVAEQPAAGAGWNIKALSRECGSNGIWDAAGGLLDAELRPGGVPEVTVGGGGE
jgi:hypothetical protein